MDKLFSMALIAKVEKTGGDLTYKLVKSISIEVDHFENTEIDEALIECLENTLELHELNLMVFIADGNLDQDIIGLDRVYMIKSDGNSEKLKIVNQPESFRKDLNEIFETLLNDLNEYLKEEENRIEPPNSIVDDD
jgi:hypothetical protein